jgi:xanthine dehydrogenase small subunit
VLVPVTPTPLFRAYKISKRFDQDISAVLGAFSVTVSGRRITSARVAFGGMAATPKRAAAAEAALTGAALEISAFEAAAAALTADFTPISDMRASAGYRLQVAANLMLKYGLDVTGAPVPRLTGAGLSADDLRATPTGTG